MTPAEKLQTLDAHLLVAENTQPSILRNSIIFWILRIAFDILFWGFFLLLLTTFWREIWLPIFEERLTTEEYKDIDDFFKAIRAFSIIGMAISYIIAWLAARGIRRNGHILELSELVDGYRDLSCDLLYGGTRP